ncbi:MAG TPA: TerB family tellurite resistance protein [Gammaproteobacteria bacterium]|nr:TerB family tellurite resistance protein [Gammaproteobacteria bacterium]
MEGRNRVAVQPPEPNHGCFGWRAYLRGSTSHPAPPEGIFLYGPATSPGEARRVVRYQTGLAGRQQASGYLAKGHLESLPTLICTGSTLDFEQFFNVYIKPRSSGQLTRDGIEFRYTAASILVACSKSDLVQNLEEEKVIRKILRETFEIPDGVLDRLIEVGETASEEEYLNQIMTFVNAQFSARDKQFLLEKLWLVALADNRVEDMERDFITRIALAMDLDADAIKAARWAADNKP